jgi:hypothetical protein
MIFVAGYSEEKGIDWGALSQRDVRDLYSLKSPDWIWDPPSFLLDA